MRESSTISLLYVDKDLDMCRIVAAFCERLGSITIKILSSGESALEWLSKSSADVIVADYDMSGSMDGITLLREFRSRGNTVPFILFTAHDGCTVREEAYRNGAFTVINKTSSDRTLIHRLIRTIYWATENRDFEKNNFPQNRKHLT
jgi:DNA-binding NtrC family response regulator